jgi:hypothetical protein
LDLLALCLQSLLITIKYRQYSATADLYTFQFTVAHALGFPIFTSRLLATDLNTETITVSLNHTLPVLQMNEAFKQTSLHKTNFPWPSSTENSELCLCHLKTENCYICNCRYIDHAENTAPIVETCLLSHCIATVAARTPQKVSHVIAISPAHWRADSCLATNYKHSFYYDYHLLGDDTVWLL